MLGDWVYIAAGASLGRHELRTPLTLILVPAAHLLARVAPDSEARCDLEVIHRNALEHFAHHDALTDLPNCVLLLSHLEHSIDRDRRLDGKVAILSMDLGRAVRLKVHPRGADTLAILRGDEFVVVLEDVHNQPEIADFARKLIDVLHEPFVLANGQTAHIGGSIGISIFSLHGDEADLLMRKADEALYRAKRAGAMPTASRTSETGAAGRGNLGNYSPKRRAVMRSPVLRIHRPLHFTGLGVRRRVADPRKPMMDFREFHE